MAVIAGVACFASAALGQPTTCDDFEDNSIDSTLWVTGGRRISWTPSSQGSWNWFHDETILDTGDPDGYLRLRVQGPGSANSFGAIAWVRTTQDFNDGVDHIINLTWKADVSEFHHQSYHIQVTDGYMATFAEAHGTPWAPVFGLPGFDGTVGLLYGDPLHHRNGQHYASSTPKQTWSITISPAAVARLYDGPDATGALVGEGTLDSAMPWYIRFMVDDATSAGFPAGDSRLNLYQFCSQATSGPACIVEYSEDFSTDPGWITDQPGNYFWDPTTQTFHATTVNAQPGPSPTRYAYALINYDGGSMTLAFDMQPVDMQWSAGVQFGLFDSNLEASPFVAPDAHYVWVHPGRVDGGLHLSLGVRGGAGVAVVENLWNVYTEGTWYHCVVEYTVSTDEVVLTVTERDTGAPVGTLTIAGVGGLPSDLDYLGFARDPNGRDCPGASGYSCTNQATANLDDIVFCEEGVACAPGEDCNGNGVADACDVDPSDPDGDGQVSEDCNTNGIPDVCEADSDGDGAIDDCEDCPDDPDKTEPGQCGCGTPDVDTDGDGLLDCDDNCPDTPNGDQADCDGDGIGDACEDVKLALVLRRTDSGIDTAIAPPDSDPTVVGDRDFVVELWATDSGAVNTGLIGVFVDLSFPSDKVEALSIDHRPPFTLLAGGTIDNMAGIVTGLGGNDETLTGQGIEPNWSRVAVVQLHALCNLTMADFMLSANAAEVSAFGRGSIAPSDVSFCGSGIEVVLDCVYDKDDDGFINSGDLSLFAPSWLSEPGDEAYDERSDFDCSGMVAAGDLGWFAAA
ncbi:MAG: hypothetical protein ACE5EX_06460 [Phycisphaerae bacterium]